MRIHRRKQRGRRLRFELRISGQLLHELRKVAATRCQSVATIVEVAVWRYLAYLASRKGARLFQRLAYANSLIRGVVAAASFITVAGGIVGAPDIHKKENRQLHRNEIGQKTKAAFDQVYELAQTEALAAENQMRAAMYEILAHLAQVNVNLLRDAADEEIIEQVEQLRQDQETFEEATRKLEAEAEEAAAKE